MTFSWPDLIPDDPLVTPHQLCRYCKRLAESLTQVDPTREGVYEHYAKLQNIIDGAWGGCHICNILIDNIIGNRRPRGPLPVWLQSHKWKVLGDGKASEMETKIITSASSAGSRIAISFDDRPRNSGEIIADFFVSIEDVTTAQEIIYSEAQLSNHVASDAHFDLIQSWIHTCTDKTQHSTCNIDIRFRKPTRLLDLTCFHEDVILIDGDVSKGPYAVLSYSWGAVLQLKLLRSNLQELQERIPFNRLSRVAQDTVGVCRKLSISYLWIDALCIIQGDDGDFSTEAPRMQDVYAVSLLTIVAADSKDTTESFLRHRNPIPWLECASGGSSLGRARKHFKVESTPFCGQGRFNRPSQYHIDSRAWCLQERFMSPRSLYFGAKGIHWECRKGLACEADPRVKKNHCNSGGINDEIKFWYATVQSMQLQNRPGISTAHWKRSHLDGENLRLCSGKCRGDDVSDVPLARRMWCELVEAYSRMHLSHLEDRLIAISGIASAFKPLLQSESTYGMWVCRVSEELLWRTCSGQKGSSRDFLPYLPSWSWIGTYDRAVTMSSTLWDPRRVDDTYFAEIVSWPSDAGFNTRLLQGPRDTRICIKGHLAPYTETWTGLKYYSSDSERPWETHSWEPFNMAQWWQDQRRVTRISRYDFDLAETTLFCLLLRCECENKDYKNEGLLLTPVNPSERTYRRAGYIKEEHPADEFPNAPPSSFVQGRFLVDLWAPLREEQEIYIV